MAILYRLARGVGSLLEGKLGKRNSPLKDDDPGQGLTLALPILAMGVLMGIIALLMRSTGKW